MAASPNGDRGGALLVKRVGESAWILRPRDALESELVPALRDAFLDAVDSGAQEIVVDLSEVDAIVPEAVATVRVMADHMLARNGGLWLAASRSGEGHALRAIEGRGPEALRGLTPALDLALEQLVREEAVTDLRKP